MFEFLCLPAEIRCKIYILLLKDPLLQWRNVTPEWPREVPWLLSCRRFNPIFRRLDGGSQRQCPAGGTPSKARWERHVLKDLSEQDLMDLSGSQCIQAMHQQVPSQVEVSYNILLTCHQVFEEAAISFYYRFAILCFERPLDFANRFLRHLEPSKTSRLQHLRFDFYHAAKAQVWQRRPAQTLSRFHHLSTMFQYYPEVSNVKNLTLELTQPCLKKTSTALCVNGSKSDQSLAEEPPIVLMDSDRDDHAINDY